jgi:undecaprenyl diphosphate synthase
MELVKKYLRRELDFYRENRIRIRHSGAREHLPAAIVQELDDVCEATKDFDGLQVILALNYGGRDEIVRAVRKLCAAGFPAAEISEKKIGENLDNPDVPDPDLIIRSAGEFRTSNFLLWQSAYAEYYISQKLWPDFSAEDFSLAIEEYQGRERRFGAESETANMEEME